ncbi:hypothetical protein OWR29_39020 [Actinoplanes sp. Pm04-4]|uniref:Uncharacterized protein n=1 Tax=Paractinoplanes pyxinae TaxID=2997416 RepID=A0ABT4BBY3_9ACTN|nr:hypothetical protein [Actinoplanes pyxinae]MCY1144023.1 hypothetical protein [Actinoplanes pyxinae]
MSLFRTASPAPTPTAPPGPTIVVALNPETADTDVLAAAVAAARRHRLSPAQPRPYFLRRRGVLHGKHAAARVSDGPLARLDLDAMRQSAVAAAGAQWRWWHHIVEGTPVARPMWSFADRHRTQPERYPYRQAESDYAAQPRILAMAAYNAMPQHWPLPLSALEAFQAGWSTYLNLAWLSAVCADGLITADGRWRTTATERLSDQVHYLNGANAYLATLTRTDHLVALSLG